MRKAKAEIILVLKSGLFLPTFGPERPLRHWAHVHFEKDITWGQATWTLLLDLAGAPDTQVGTVDAVIYFLSPEAPLHLLEKDAKFELVCGQSFYGTGRITTIVEN